MMESQQFLGYLVKIRRRAFYRRISVSVKPTSEIVVTCGKLVPPFVLSQFLLGHAEWIEKTQAKFAKFREMHPPQKIADGEKVLFKGEYKRFKFIRPDEKRPSCVLVGDEIWVSGDPVKAVLGFYKREGTLALQKAVHEWSMRMNLVPSGVTYRCQRTRWGSCSSQGRLSLNWRLIAMPQSTLEYVVVHELAHLRHKNHGKSFWNLVAAHFPDFKTENQRLRELQYHVDFLCAKSELHGPKSHRQSG